MASIFMGCDDDDPSYTNIVTDVQELNINLDETAEGQFQVVQGNGNYKVTSSDESVITAVAEGNTIKVTALKSGEATLSIIDWAKMSAVVKVSVDQLQDLVLNTQSTSMYPDETKMIGIYSGNRGYKVQVDNENVVKASMDDSGQIKLTSIAPGTAKVTLTDKQNKSAELSVKVIKRLVVENTSAIELLTIDEPVTIQILDGNGGYTCVNNGSKTYLSCEMSQDGNSVIIKGLKRYRFNKTITIKDAENQSVDISIVYIDNPYGEAEGLFTFLKTSSSYQGLAIPKGSKIFYSEDLDRSQMISYSSTSATSGGYAIEFDGDLSVGDKSNAVLYKVSRRAIVKDKPYETSECRIDKAENGYYWVSFMEPNCTLRSYMILKGE